MADDTKMFDLATILSAGPKEAYDTFSRENSLFFWGVCVCKPGLIYRIALIY